MNFDLSRSVDVLRRTPAVVDGLLRGSDAKWTRSNEGPDTFSPFDVVGHLIDGEEHDWIGRAQIILAGNRNAQFDVFDRFRHRSRNAGRTLESLLDEFATLRAKNLAALQSWKLTDAQLALVAQHPKFGDVTLRQLLATWVAHDLGHVAQISRVMAKQYATDVGPWIEFLPVLTDHPTPRS
jgi:hypothetical protein